MKKVLLMVLGCCVLSAFADGQEKVALTKEKQVFNSEDSLRLQAGKCLLREMLLESIEAEYEFVRCYVSESSVLAYRLGKFFVVDVFTGEEKEVPERLYADESDLNEMIDKLRSQK